MLSKALNTEAKLMITEDLFDDNYKQNKDLNKNLEKEIDNLMSNDYFNTFLNETLSECVIEAYKKTYIEKYNKCLKETNKKLALLHNEKYQGDTFYTDNLSTEYDLTVTLLVYEYGMPLDISRKTVRIYDVFERKINRLIKELKKVITDRDVIYDLDEYRLITYKI